MCRAELSFRVQVLSAPCPWAPSLWAELGRDLPPPVVSQASIKPGFRD
jgi:hypothetical protein